MNSLLSLTRVEPLEARIAPASFLVNTNADSGPGSLRQAILDANASVGLDGIRFNLQPGSTIGLLSPLPEITDRVSIIVLPVGGLTGPAITIDGTRSQGSTGLNDGSGLMLIGPGANESQIAGLAIFGFDEAGIELVNCTKVRVFSNYLGVRSSGIGGLEPMSEGVLISG